MFGLVVFRGIGGVVLLSDAYTVLLDQSVGEGFGEDIDDDVSNGLAV